MNDEFWSRAFASGSESVFQSFLIDATKSLIQATIDSGAMISLSSDDDIVI